MTRALDAGRVPGFHRSDSGFHRSDSGSPQSGPGFNRSDSNSPHSAATAVLGVDGCRAGWVVAELSRGVRLSLLPDFASVMALPGAMLALDMPVGLADGARVQPRVCDAEARRELGPRRSTVFAPPLRGMLQARRYGPRLRGAGLSIQAFHLLPKLREVDAAVSPGDQQRVIEAHPELAFARLAGEPLMEPKRGREGRDLRLSLLAAGRAPALPRVKEALADFLASTRRKDVAEDDALDALALVRTAWLRQRGRARRLPGSDEDQRDARGLRMEIWW